MDKLLEGKKILLGVTGSISAYKACELARFYVKAGAKVRVVMSEAAMRFVSPLTFEALTRLEVLCEQSERWSSDQNHIDIGKWADVYVIAPATANTINKLSAGIADNLVLQVALAYTKRLVVAPAANTHMYLHPTVTHSLKQLEQRGVHLVSPTQKLLACGDEGVGALAEVEDIFDESAKVLLQEEFWQGKEAIVTAGGTVEKIDEVRYISNFSSGKMGASIARALYYLGAKVTLITTKEPDVPRGIEVKRVMSAMQMQEALKEAIENRSKKPYLFMAAAVADYRPKQSHSGKLKKCQTGKEWCLELVQNPDILATVGADEAIKIGFKAEMDEIKAYAHAKEALVGKEAQMICLNILKDSKSFGSDDNSLVCITHEDTITLPKSSKLILAFALAALIKERDDK